MAKGKILLSIFFFGLFLTSAFHGEVSYPWKDVYIGALEGKAWNGLVFVPNKDAAFAFRFRMEKEDQVADGDDIHYLISEVGPHSPDGQYSRIKMDAGLPFNQRDETPILVKPAKKKNIVTLEWSRQDEKTVIGRIRGPKFLKIQLVQYFPWELQGRYRLLPDGQIQGQISAEKSFHYLLWTDRRGQPSANSNEAEITISFSLEEDRSLYFVAGVGDDPRILRNHIYRYKNRKTIDSFLEEEQNRYNKKRAKIEGLYEDVAEAITNNLFWMILYQPGSHQLYTPAGRKWMYPKPDGTPDDWTIFEWDSFFNSLEVAAESFKLSKDIIKTVLETQYPNGNIPNWRSRSNGSPDRSQPPVGAYCVLKLFGKSGDLELLKFSYPFLKRWHSFWKAKKPNGQARRDGNGDGLLEWGSDSEFLASRKFPAWEENANGKTRAAWESGQDDLPNWDDATFSEETGTMTMTCLDLNCLYALDAWCLAQMAKLLNLAQDYDFYSEEYEEMKGLINKKLWNDKEEFYYDRYWDGKFSRRKAASNFYPLLARIPDQQRALRMITKHLLNPKEFWGDYIIPSISRDDPAFKDQQYWRGTIWPPTNYLVYQGLKAYGLDAVASEFAQKSSALFLRSWQNFQLCPENFDSRTGEAGGQRYQSWGPLFALIGLEEYLDFTPWEGFRFGIIEPEDHGKLSRISIQGRNYDVEVSRSLIKLKEEDREIFRASGGAVIRHFLYNENEISFEVKSLAKRKIEIQFIKKGKYQLSIDSQEKRVFKGRSVEFELPEGDHAVLILLLSEAED